MVVKFRMIVFRPFKGEVIIGKITNGTEQGIKSTDIDADIDVDNANDEQLELSSSTTSSSLQTCCWTVLDCMSSYKYRSLIVHANSRQ